MMPRKTLLIINMIAAVGLITVMMSLVLLPQPYEFKGSLFEPPAEAYAFELIRADGSKYRLQDQRGKVVLIFFGYTNCPDVCPTTLSDFKKIKLQLGDQADQVEFVFITVDPERDTVQHIENYVSAFDPAFVGLSGTPEELSAVWDGYFVSRAKATGDSAVGYLMSHTARVFIVDQQGDLRLTFPFGIEVDDMAADILQLLRQTRVD